MSPDKVNLRLIACISICHDWNVKALDIRSAFLQGEVLEAFIGDSPERDQRKRYINTLHLSMPRYD